MIQRRPAAFRSAEPGPSSCRARAASRSCLALAEAHGFGDGADLPADFGQTVGLSAGFLQVGDQLFARPICGSVAPGTGRGCVAGRLRPGAGCRRAARYSGRCSQNRSSPASSSGSRPTPLGRAALSFFQGLEAQAQFVQMPPDLLQAAGFALIIGLQAFQPAHSGPAFPVIPNLNVVFTQGGR